MSGTLERALGRRPSACAAALLALVVAAMTAAVAGAATTADPPLLTTPAFGQVFEAEPPLVFEAQDQPEAYATWFLLSTEPVLTGDGYLADAEMIETVRDASGRTTAAEGHLSGEWAPGVYYWQAFRIDCEHSEGRFCAVPSAVSVFRVGFGTPPPVFETTYVDDDLLRTPIPRNVGASASYGYRTSLASMPDGIGYDRFMALVSVTGSRWGLQGLGDNEEPVRSGDGRNSVGFSDRVGRSSLGVTTTRLRLHYRGGVVVRREVRERDIQLSTRVAWHAGPGRPSRSQHDLQTTLIHEFGHFAGNELHMPRCSNSPMPVGLAPGEWWHSRRDHYFRGCGMGARPASAAGDGRPLRFAHERIVERVGR